MLFLLIPRLRRKVKKERNTSFKVKIKNIKKKDKEKEKKEKKDKEKNKRKLKKGNSEDGGLDTTEYPLHGKIPTAKSFWILFPFK